MRGLRLQGGQAVAPGFGRLRLDEQDQDLRVGAFDRSLDTVHALFDLGGAQAIVKLRAQAGDLPVTIAAPNFTAAMPRLAASAACTTPWRADGGGIQLLRVEVELPIHCGLPRRRDGRINRGRPCGRGARF